MSVDLGPSSQTYRPPLQRRQSVYSHRSLRLNRSRTIGPTTSGAYEPCCLLDRYHKNSQALSDDSYVSAKSKISGSVRTINAGFESPKKLISDLSDSVRQPSSSKTSLTSSTYKAFQSPFANIKRFFRNSIPKQFGATSHGADETDSASQVGQKDHERLCSVIEKSTNTGFSNDSFKSSLSKYTSDFSVGDSASIFNRSQTPPACPPPPGELKSMCYMGGSINYSNYDEFTRLRNRRLGNRPHSLEDPDDLYKRQTSSVLPRLPPQPPPVHRLISGHNGLHSSTARQQQTVQDCDQSGDSESWQLASLPVYFEHNLTTLFEEQKAPNSKPQVGSTSRPASANFMSIYQQPKTFDPSNSARVQANGQSSDNGMIRPPKTFDDCRSNLRANDSTLTRSNSKVCSNQSLSSSTTTESVFDYQRQPVAVVPASPYRFSFAQPLPPTVPLSVNVPNQNSNGLPPRVPSTATTSSSTLPTLTDTSNDGASRFEVKQISDNNSSSGNSSNCSSSQLNVVHNRDSYNQVGNCDRNSYSDDPYSTGVIGGCGGNLSAYEHDGDTTLLSETSTIRGDMNGTAFYINKCSELERTVTTLKNKLISKEKELTDLQLSQLHNDYTIDKLKSQVSKLEKENAHLKGLLYNNNKQNLQQSLTNGQMINAKFN